MTYQINFQLWEIFNLAEFLFLILFIIFLCVLVTYALWLLIKKIAAAAALGVLGILVKMEGSGGDGRIVIREVPPADYPDSDDPDDRKRKRDKGKEKIDEEWENNARAEKLRRRMIKKLMIMLCLYCLRFCSRFKDCRDAACPNKVGEQASEAEAHRVAMEEFDYLDKEITDKQLRKILKILDKENHKLRQRYPKACYFITYLVKDPEDEPRQEDYDEHSGPSSPADSADSDSE